MGGSEPPYMYQPMQGRRQVIYPYSDFNPRAATQAHYAALSERADRQKRRAAQAGKPLINFNQHPDSYMIVGAKNINFEPLSPNTKKMVTMMRWIQFAVRLLQDVIAIGLLVCVICLKMDLNTVGWISRIAPAWDIVVTTYAIYHLIRPARARTPATSASYHFFALFMDTGLITFYIFVALCANQNWNEVAGVEGRWTSLFSTYQATTELIMLAFIGSTVLAGLHLVSVLLDFYLIIMFRKIARLPPDMNPLEDNLTTRRPRSTKHKHKNSEATLVSDSAEPVSEKRQHYLSGSTLDVDRLSHISTAKGPEVRTIPFGHSRMNSDNSFSPHNPDTARWSRQQFDDSSRYDGTQTFERFNSDLHDDHQPRQGSVNPSKRATFVENTPQHSLVASHLDTLSNPTFNYSSAEMPAKSQQAQNLLNDNWYVVDDNDIPSDLGTARLQNHSNPAYAQVLKSEPQHERHDSFNPQPLRMNPPTPPLANETYPDPEDHNPPVKAKRERGFTVTSRETKASSIYSESSPSLVSSNQRPKSSGTTPKGKYYGDLAAATRGVRGAAVAHSKGGYGIPPTPETSRSRSPAKKQEKQEKREQQQQKNSKGGRVVSRTGADIGDTATVHVHGQGPWAGMRGRRDVSGKAAEEGRGGRNWRRE